MSDLIQDNETKWYFVVKQGIAAADILIFTLVTTQTQSSYYSYSVPTDKLKHGTVV